MSTPYVPEFYGSNMRDRNPSAMWPKAYHNCRDQRKELKQCEREHHGRGSVECDRMASLEKYCLLQSLCPDLSYDYMERCLARGGIERGEISPYCREVNQRVNECFLPYRHSYQHDVSHFLP